MGTDSAGTVAAVGSKVFDLKPGDSVVGTVPMKRFGVVAPALITTPVLWVKTPAKPSLVRAASLPVAGLTAWLVLVKPADLRLGQKRFINGATGTVGNAAICHRLGDRLSGDRSVRTATHIAGAIAGAEP